MTLSLSLLPPLGGLAFCLLLGVGFSVMASASLALNRLRLLDLFGDESGSTTSEHEVIRDTKEVYFVSRLGLYATLVGAGLCLLAFLEDALASRAWAVGLSLALLPPLYALCVFGVPRFLVRRRPVESEEQVAGVVRLFMAVVRPVGRLARISSIVPIGRLLPRHEITKNDLVSLVTELDVEDEDENEANGGEAATEGETDEEEIIYNLLDLDETLVREVMKPINSVVALRLSEATPDAVRALARRTGHSRFPVYHDRIVDLVGYVSVYDILYDEGEPRAIESYVSDAYFVPEFMRVSSLLQEFRERGRQVAVVVDEYGGSSGWVTREDVLEEIVGEIEDEFDPRRRQIQSLENGALLVDGAIDIDDLAEELPLHFEDPQYDTLAGFVLMTLGAIPAEGERVVTDEAVFTVERVEGQRVALVRIVLSQQEEDKGG